jgi:hypothetical protein
VSSASAHQVSKSVSIRRKESLAFALAEAAALSEFTELVGGDGEHLGQLIHGGVDAAVLVFLHRVLLGLLLVGVLFFGAIGLVDLGFSFLRRLMLL